MSKKHGKKNNKKHNKNIDKNKDEKTENLTDLVKNFFKLQNQYNHYRIEEYKIWSDMECSCPICVDYTVQLCEEEEPKYCKGFKEEWE
ncbi:MAG: hypothetical protein OR994_07720 [Candidatus Poseidoniales archaeon]|nr:hypothetical protein [Candidatus Poseidoniales archaeon]